MGSMHYGADGIIYDDSPEGGGKAVTVEKAKEIEGVTLTKYVTIEKIVKTGIVLLNMYNGVDELKASGGLLLAPEPTMLTKAAAGYLAGDGASRFISGPFQIYGIWNNDKQYENAPGNLLGLAGNGKDNLKSTKPGYVTGGDAQLVGEMIGDFGLARRSLYKAIMSPQGVSKMKDIIRLGKIINSIISPAKTGYQKGEKMKKNGE